LHWIFTLSALRREWAAVAKKSHVITGAIWLASAVLMIVYLLVLKGEDQRGLVVALLVIGSASSFGAAGFFFLQAIPTRRELPSSGFSRRVFALAASLALPGEDRTPEALGAAQPPGGPPPASGAPTPKKRHSVTFWVGFFAAIPTIATIIGAIITEYNKYHSQCTQLRKTVSQMHDRTPYPKDSWQESKCEINEYIRVLANNPKPTVSLRVPVSGSSYKKGANIKASYICKPGAGARLSECRGTVGNGKRIPTSAIGRQVFTVTAKDADGRTTRRTITYRVVH
jgi:hypothetical protein